MPNQHTKNPISAPVRFWTKVDFAGPVPAARPELGPCWLWTGYCGESGYGQFFVDGHLIKAHRWAYEFCVGPIPEGLTLDHLCRGRNCVLSVHLEPVTQRTNVLRSPVAPTAIHARKTYCKWGHPFDETNTYVRLRRGGRDCKICSLARTRKRRRLAREALDKQDFANAGHPDEEELMAEADYKGDPAKEPSDARSGA